MTSTATIGVISAIDVVANDLDLAMGKHQSFSYRYSAVDHSTFDVVVSSGWTSEASTPVAPNSFATTGTQLLASYVKGTTCTLTPPAQACTDAGGDSVCSAAKADNYARKHQLCRSGRFHAKCDATCEACSTGPLGRCSLAEDASSVCSGHGVCKQVGMFGKCVCSAGYRGVSCDKQCPVKDGKICNGKGSCDSGGKCVCYGGFTGTDCSQGMKVLKFELADTGSDPSAELPGALAAATKVSASRFKVRSSTTNAAKTKRAIKIEVLDPATAMTESKLWQRSNGRDGVLMEMTDDEIANQGESAAALVAQIQQMAESNDSTLKTGPLASLQGVEQEPTTTCTADLFYSCTDQTCMPKTTGETEIPSGGQCCSYNVDTGASSHCPKSTASAWEQSLTRCVTIGNSYSCTSATVGSSHSGAGRYMYGPLYQVLVACGAAVVALAWGGPG